MSANQRPPLFVKDDEGMMRVFFTIFAGFASDLHVQIATTAAEILFEQPSRAAQFVDHGCGR